LSYRILDGCARGSQGSSNYLSLSSTMRQKCTSLPYLAFIEHRKIMYIPFPFPHAQLSTFYTVVMVLVIPFLMDQYVSIDGISMVWVGCLLTFLTVTCLVGLHEVSRELENPFRNVPNDLPLVTLHAMYNEALVTMYSGFNPDSFWDPALYRVSLEALSAKRDYNIARRNDDVRHDNRSSNSNNDNRRSVRDPDECRNGETMSAVVATTMMPATVKDSLAIKYDKKVECGTASANRAVEDYTSAASPIVSSFTLADARMRMKKTVSFADETSGTTIIDDDSINNTVDDNVVVVTELRNILVEQAMLIEELGRMLDD
jgi:hypothetical protein